MDSIIDLNSLDDIFTYGSAFFGAFLVALWLSLIIWTYHDIRSRNRDRLIQIFSTLIVALLTIPGLAIYLILRPKATLDELYQKSLEEEALLTSIELRRACPGCGATVQVDWQICAHCHTRIKKTCGQCGKLLELPWQMCPFCATPTPGSPYSVVDLDEESSDVSVENSENISESIELPDEEIRVDDEADDAKQEDS